MNFRFLLLIITFFILSACNQELHKDEKINIISEQKYKNTGFTLVYSNKLKKEKKISKKIDDRALVIFHKNLKKDSFVKITNPSNQKTIIAKVISNNVKFSEFYNSVITNRIAEELSLNLDEPYINLVLISQNSTFIAKKAKTFEAEKKVAEKVPVDGIKIDNLGKVKEEKKQIKLIKISYSIKIADFYYEKSALQMIDRVKNETSIKKIKIKSLSKTNYRVFLGPFNDINSLKNSYNKALVLNFENLEIIRHD